MDSEDSPSSSGFQPLIFFVHSLLVSLPHPVSSHVSTYAECTWTKTLVLALWLFLDASRLIYRNLLFDAYNILELLLLRVLLFPSPSVYRKYQQDLTYTRPKYSPMYNHLPSTSRIIQLLHQDHLRTSF